MTNALKPLLWLGCILLAFTGLAWQNNPVDQHNATYKDTVPAVENNKRIDKTVIDGDLDKALEEVKKAKQQLEQQLQNKDWEKTQQQLQQSLQQLKQENIQEQLARAMKEIDYQKIQLQAQAALKQVDWQKMQADMQRAQESLKNNFDSQKIKEEIQRAMEQSKKAMADIKEMDMEKLQQQLEKAQEAMQLDQGRIKENIEKAEREIRETLQKDFKKDVENAKQAVENAQQTLQNYKSMLAAMEQDGLLKTSDPYNIEYKDGELIINGKTQPATITGKYKHYFKKDNVQLKKEKDGNEKTIHL